jgi:hypothetical protein
MTTPRAGTARDLLRHTVATLAYRAEKVLRDPPPGFAEYRISPASRSALDIVSHLGDLMAWAERLAQGEYVWTAEPAGEWTNSCDRFFQRLRSLDEALAAATLEKYPAEIIFQGPIADALTHIGQLSLMRGAAGAAVRPESYARADIATGRVGREQSAIRKEFDGDASKRNAPASPPPPPAQYDPVTEASEESFPASDPPAATPTGGSKISPSD